MNNLPMELHLKILDYLDLNDLFNYRLLSKQHRDAVNYYPIKEIQFDSEMKKFNWFYTNHLNDFGYFVNELNFFPFLKNSPFNLKDLKYLSINFSIIDFDLLNEFTKLENLNIRIYKPKNLNSELKLTNLKSLTMNQIEDSITINTPNLIAFQLINRYSFYYDNDYDYVDKLKFVYPLKIEILYLFTFDRRLIFQFKNLTTLKMMDNDYFFNSPNNLTTDFLENMPSLKLIDFATDFCIENMTAQKTKLNRTDLIMYKQGLPIDKFDPTSYHSINEYLINLELVNDVCPSNVIYYDCSKNSIKIGPKFPIYKLNSILNISVRNYVEDEDQLIFLIKSCKNLQNLFIEYSGLTNQFYDQLNCLSLFTIYIHESDLELDFKFISKMFYLKKLTTNLDFNLDKSFKLDRLIYLDSIKFKINSNFITINKLEKNRYSIETTKKVSVPDKEFKFIELVNWINYMRFKKNKIMIIDRSNLKRKRKVKDPVFSLWKKRTI